MNPIATAGISPRIWEIRRAEGISAIQAGAARRWRIIQGEVRPGGSVGFTLALLLLFATVLHAEDRSLHLAIGDPARKDKEAPLVLDGVTDTRKGDVVTPAEMAKRLAGARLVLVGESHTDMDFHRAQLRVIEELVRSGRPVFLGLEMYPYTEQRFLDQWVEGLLTEEGFLRLSRWYENWGYNWNYYRDIFLFARDHKVRMFAVNAPRDVVTAVRKKD